jgi:hypothetical protein
VILAEVLNKTGDIRQQRSVSRFLQAHNERVRAVKKLQETAPAEFRCIKDMVLQSMLFDIRTSYLTRLDHKVETYMKNVAVANVPRI